MAAWQHIILHAVTILLMAAGTDFSQLPNAVISTVYTTFYLESPSLLLNTLVSVYGNIMRVSDPINSCMSPCTQPPTSKGHDRNYPNTAQSPSQQQQQ